MNTKICRLALGVGAALLVLLAVVLMRYEVTALPAADGTRAPMAARLDRWTGRVQVATRVFVGPNGAQEVQWVWQDVMVTR